MFIRTKVYRLRASGSIQRGQAWTFHYFLSEATRDSKLCGHVQNVLFRDPVQVSGSEAFLKSQSHRGIMLHDQA
jgi:hypothetical protein